MSLTSRNRNDRVKTPAQRFNHCIHCNKRDEFNAVIMFGFIRVTRDTIPIELLLAVQTAPTFRYFPSSPSSCRLTRGFNVLKHHLLFFHPRYQGADKSLARPGREQAPKHDRNACDFNNIETRAVIKFLFSCKSRRRRKFTPF